MLEVRLHGALWRRATLTRAAEWRRSLEELNGSNTMAVVGEPVDEPAIEFVRPPDGSYELRLYREAFDCIARVSVERSAVEGFFAEYSATIAQLVHVDRDAPVRGYEAIDYAKRVVHDEAAGFLREAVENVVSMDLADARCLFTLLFLIGTDLPESLVRYHRMHGQ